MFFLRYILLIVIYAAALFAGVWLCVRDSRHAPPAAGGQRRTAFRLFWALLAALLLFLAAESAICRRLGPDLLLPVQEGQALPGRAALQGAALILCLAAAATDRGRALGGKLRTALEKDRYRWLAAAVVTAVFFLWIWRVAVIRFMTNDDVPIMRSIGHLPEWGPAVATDTFSQPLFGLLVGSLYYLEPGGYWYAGYHLAVIAVSLTVAGRCILLKLRRYDWPVCAGLVLQVLLGCAVFLCPAVTLSFTVTPAVAGTAAAALLLCRDETKGTAGLVCTDIGSFLLMLLCVLQRTETGKCLLCFWLLAAGYQFLKLLLRRDAHRWRSALCFAGTILLAMVLCSAANSVTFRPESTASEEETAQADAEYAWAESRRSTVMDYLLPKLSNDQLEAVGIPHELAILFRAWYFMDERICTDTFQRIIDTYGYLMDSPGTEELETDDSAQSTPWEQFSAQYATATSNESPEGHRFMRNTALVIAVLTGLALLSLWGGGKRHLFETVFALFAAGGAAILSLYLIREGRFPLRVSLVVFIPAIVMMLLLILDIPEGARRPWAPVPKVLTWVLAAGLLALDWQITLDVPHVTEAVTRQDVFYSQHAVEDFANSHPELDLVTSFSSLNLDPFHDVRTYPYNMWLWGGTGTTSSKNRNYADHFFQDDVRFMYEYPSTLVLMLQYLSLDQGPVQAQIVSQLTPEIYVADLSQVSPGGDYTGWYEQNGLTYYFQDGKALTGEQVIDGENYTFAPAGDAAAISAAPDPDGLIYTTTAYSLVTGP